MSEENCLYLLADPKLPHRVWKESKDSLGMGAKQKHKHTLMTSAELDKASQVHVWILSSCSFNNRFLSSYWKLCQRLTALAEWFLALIRHKPLSSGRVWRESVQFSLLASLHLKKVPYVAGHIMNQESIQINMTHWSDERCTPVCVIVEGWCLCVCVQIYPPSIAFCPETLQANQL